MERPLLAAPSNAPVLATQLDHNALLNLAVADAHPHYALLAGRVGGQTLIGGTAAGNALTLRGSSDAALGTVALSSPLIIGNMLAAAAGGTPRISHTVAYAPSAAVYVEVFQLNAPVITANSSVITLYTAFSQHGSFLANSTGTGIVNLFTATATLSSSSGSVAPFSFFALDNAILVQRAIGSAGAAQVETVTVRHNPVVSATVSGAIQAITEQTAVQVLPRFNTVTGATAGLGIVRGVWCRAPDVMPFGSQTGTESIADYLGVDFDGMTSPETITGQRVVVRSNLAAASANRFLRNIGGARSEDAGQFAWLSGGRPKVEQDGVGLVLGLSDDVEIYWEVTNRLVLSPVSGASIDWAWSTAGNFVSFNQASSPGDWGLRHQFTRFSYGTATVPNPTATVRYFEVDPQQRTPPAAGLWSDFVIDSASNAILANALAMTTISGGRFEAPNVTLTSGSIADLVTLHVVGQGGATATRKAGLWVESARSRFEGVWSFSAITPAQLTANVDNWTGPGSGASARLIVRVSSDAARTINGIVPDNATDSICLVNVGTNNVLLGHEVGSSTATNRLKLPGAAAYTIAPDEGVWLWHDPTTDRWRIIDK